MDLATEISPETRTAVSNEIARIHAQHFGRGPEETKTFADDRFVFCVMRGGLTQLERTLIDGGAVDLVRAVRLRFQELMAPVFFEAVERVVGRPVIDYHSQLLMNAQHVVEVFVLGEPRRDATTEVG
ncbi:MAG TPA: Na-translocating system protein MpsC family protein [Acidimicrobiales bacterium]|nr:Na-translocating system protein MpsC family protein [Acidimicrobiales bacterium]